MRPGGRREPGRGARADHRRGARRLRLLPRRQRRGRPPRRRGAGHIGDRGRAAGHRARAVPGAGHGRHAGAALLLPRPGLLRARGDPVRAVVPGGGVAGAGRRRAVRPDAPAVRAVRARGPLAAERLGRAGPAAAGACQAAGRLRGPAVHQRHQPAAAPGRGGGDAGGGGRRGPGQPGGGGDRRRAGHDRHLRRPVRHGPPVRGQRAVLHVAAAGRVVPAVRAAHRGRRGAGAVRDGPEHRDRAQRGRRGGPADRGARAVRAAAGQPGRGRPARRGRRLELPVRRGGPPGGRARRQGAGHRVRGRPQLRARVVSPGGAPLGPRARCASRRGTGRPEGQEAPRGPGDGEAGASRCWP
jgi:hypothetical protein